MKATEQDDVKTVICMRAVKQVQKISTNPPSYTDNWHRANVKKFYTADQD